MNMRKATLVKYIFIFSFFFTNADAVTNNDFLTYRNNEFNFSFWYPKSWRSVPTTNAETKIKVASNMGNGVDDCNVVAIKRDIFKNMSSKEYLSIAQNGFPGVLRKQFPDIQFIESGVTTLSNKDAYYIVSEATYKIYKFNAPMRSLTVVSLDSNSKYGIQYVITCRTTPKRFEVMRPIFKSIISDFVIGQPYNN